MITLLKGEKAVRKLLPSIVTVLMLSAAASEVQSQRAKGTQTFASFWVQFKAALAKNDKEAVTSMTRFPFYWGDELTRGEFIKKYNKIFDRKIQRCFAKAKPLKDRESYSVFCSESIYVFEKVEGKYRFTGVGVND
jgi:hypothetical protein